MKYEPNGFSIPIIGGGIQWNKKLSQKDKIKWLFIYLESKRILTNPTKMEKKEWCVMSVLEIKNTFIEIMKETKFSDKYVVIFKKFISICNKYLNDIESLELPHIIFKGVSQSPYTDFYNAMNNFRDGMKNAIERLEKISKIKFNKELPKSW